MFYLVFAKNVPNPQYGGATSTVWMGLGVYRADKAEDACKAAAKKIGAMGTYFAVEGSPWGLDMLEVDGVHELGDEPELDPTLEQKGIVQKRSPTGEWGSGWWCLAGPEPKCPPLRGS